MVPVVIAVMEMRNYVLNTFKLEGTTKTERGFLFPRLI